MVFRALDALIERLTHAFPCPCAISLLQDAYHKVTSVVRYRQILNEGSEAVSGDAPTMMGHEVCYFKSPRACQPAKKSVYAQETFSHVLEYFVK